MKLDPQIPVDRLLGGIPSSAQVFSQFGIVTEENKNSSLQDVCRRAGISVADFLQALDRLDWNDE